MSEMLEKLINVVEQEMKLNDTDAQCVINKARSFVKLYVEENNLKSLVIGISGGLDSAVVAALCQEKYTGVPLIGVMLPINTTNEHRRFANWVGRNFCTEYETLNGVDDLAVYLVEDVTFANSEFISGDVHEKIRVGNIRARVRMMVLYDLARAKDGLVLSTDNYSEYLAGFWTLHGDVGDLSPIQYILKGLELRSLARVLGIDASIIDQEPSDGLNVTEENTDHAQLGMDYQTFDAILMTYLGKVESDEAYFIYRDLMDKNDPTVLKAIARYENTAFKRNNPVSVSRGWLGLKEK